MRNWLESNFTVTNLRSTLFVLFTLSILLFPLGQALRVILPLLCLPIVTLLYIKDWKNATLRILPIRWLLLIFFVSFIIQLVTSEWLAASWTSVRPNLLRGFILVFVGMEVVRSEKELQWLVIIFAITFFYEGVDGIWQALTGFDYIKHTAIMDGRLTGSLGTYRVGNYMAILALPAFGVWVLLPVKNNRLHIITVTILLSPGLFLWLGSFTRIGYLAFFVAFYALWLCIWTKFSWLKVFVPPALFIVVLSIFGVARLSWETMLNDPRIELWTKAFEIGKKHLWLGTGSSTFVLALQKQGINLQSVPSIDLEHPHNMYIQFFVDGGIIGFTCYLLFFIGVTLWTLFHIRKGVQEEIKEVFSGYYWQLLSFIWAGWVAYLITGFCGHNFYRTWWLSIASTLLGILLGGCQWGKRIIRKDIVE